MTLRKGLQYFGRALLFALALLWIASAFAAPAERGARANPAAAAADGALGDIMLTQVRLEDAVRLLSQVGKTNIVVTGKVSEVVVSLYLRDSRVDDMIRNLCRAAGVWYRYDSVSKTYLIMSGEEYQKDLAIVRDEQTRVFTLRHHNVVSTANAIRALFGSRVQLVAPVEEMPPTSLGSGSRTSTGGSRGYGSGSRSGSRNYGSNNRSRNYGAGSGAYGGYGGGGGGMEPLPDTSTFSGATASSGGGGGGTAYDPATDLARIGMDRLQSQTRQGEEGEPATVSITEIQELAARQGPPIHVTYNRLNNLLLVRTGDEKALTQITLLIADMDRPPRQVLLEMKILEVTLDDGFRSVFDIGASSRGSASGPGTTVGEDGVYPVDALRNAFSSGLFAAEQNATFVWQAMSRRLSARFQLLAEQNKLKVLSSPMLVAANNQPARLFIGDERVLTVGASSESITGTTGANNTTVTVETETRDIGQTLSILPRINGDRSVSLTIDQDSSTVKIGDATIPVATINGDIYYFPIDTVNTASLQVTAHAQDGMTVAIGGMIRDSTQYEDQKVPLLGDIPILGTLFKRDVRAASRSQIVLLITPRVLDNPDESDALAREKTEDYEALTSTFPNKPIVPTPASMAESLSGAADSLSGFAAEVTSGEAPRPEAQNAKARSEDAVFTALARSAAAAVRQTDPTAAAPDGLLPLPVTDRGPLALSGGIQARVVASWIRDGLYVTALRVVNTAPSPGDVTPALIRGRWAAMVLEKTRLAGAGGDDSRTWAYAISQQPFEEAVERP
ncbi:MAG: hypothetical protein LBI59_08190 [Candidatus Accumulibacter sp.]|jgi:general secretion pathway protein D|nr:hypothetical protein [Accumulibacter sp.]